MRRAPWAISFALLIAMAGASGASAEVAAGTTITAGNAQQAEGLIPANSSCTVTAQVTAAAAGTYVNSLPAGALQTDHGNNAGPATATLTVRP